MRYNYFMEDFDVNVVHMCAHACSRAHIHTLALMQTLTHTHANTYCRW